MIDAPAFFVPGIAPDKQEEVYAQLAELCCTSVPPLEGRIYSISYLHDGEEWTATVGEKLHGIRRKRPSRKSRRTPPPIDLEDSALILAIFPGTPYKVFTNGGGEHRSVWANPFLAGQPRSATHFSLTR